MSRRGVLLLCTLVCLAACIVVIRSLSQPAGSNRWEAAIQRFEDADRRSPPEHGGVLFIGSSSAGGWSLDESFPGKGYINRGFGGSKIADSTRYAHRIIFPHRPRIVVMFVGDNDVHAGRSPRQLVADFRAFAKQVHSYLPNARIFYLAVKPSPKRWNLYPKMEEANNLISEFVASDSRLTFVDIATPMLGQDGKPKAELFREDKLHLSAQGYELVTSLLKPHLESGDASN